METNSLIDEINESYNQSLQHSSNDSIDHVNIEMLEPVSTTLSPPAPTTSDMPASAASDEPTVKRVIKVSREGMRKQKAFKSKTASMINRTATR